ncbi:uncharacterized protein LOC120170219 [Hibiscus syriacus]|uniref:uncharacterized protein LOC120170219 n=1 Tax=Hibiscus syriacus TaxID=106335 RepID=UPI00192410EA|nr:uncharacterized protein LOC120170219 [Hibiscus syriacus]
MEGLEAAFSEKEVWEAIFYSDSTKAPGPDGFTMGFLKKFWPIMKENIMKFVQDFHKGRQWENGVNHSFISIIPKKLNLEVIEDFRPISLVSSIYKIISKVLSKRLVSVINDIVSPSQFAFIPGRQLLDCALLANEGIEYWRKRGRRGVVFKVDFRRAYDSVEWRILLRLMKVMGFGEKWISWIDRYISTASISVLVNGSPTKEFHISKGLRQGCSLSPLLFNLVGELLNLMLIKAADVGLFQGFRIGRNGNSFHLTHLQFADDLILFCSDSPMQILNIRRVLRVFSVMMGLHLNLSKSTLYGVNVGVDRIMDWANEAGCGVGSFPMTYLGLPIGSSRNSIVKVTHKLNTLMANFLWGENQSKNRIHWVNCNLVCKPFEEGGLGILDIRLMNRALLGKWVWKFANEKNSRWKKMICCKNNVSNLSLALSHAASPIDSWVWRGILNNYVKDDTMGECLRTNSKIQLGNGRSIAFWTDVWVNNLTLKAQFPRIFALSTNKRGLVAEFGGFHNNVWVWNILLRRNLCDWELKQWITLMSLLDNIAVSDSVKDFLAWSGNGAGLFSVKSYRQTLSSNSECKFEWKKWVWTGLAPPRVQTFLWQVCHRKLAIRVELRKRGIPLDNVLCPLCGYLEETIPFPSSILGQTYGRILLLEVIPAVVLWSIWKARNLVVFDNGNLDNTALFFFIRLRLAKWYLAKYPTACLQTDLLVGDPSRADQFPQPSCSKKVIGWSPPPSDMFKFNVDGAVTSDGLRGGIGGILRDSNSSTLATFSTAVGSTLPILAELKAIKEGNDFSYSSGWCKKGRLIIESDSKSAVDWIKNQQPAPTSLRDLVQEIGALIYALDVLRWIPRSCNMEADKLAKQGLVDCLSPALGNFKSGLRFAIGTFNQRRSSRSPLPIYAALRRPCSSPSLHRTQRLLATRTLPPSVENCFYSPLFFSDLVRQGRTLSSSFLFFPDLTMETQPPSQPRRNRAATVAAGAASGSNSRSGFSYSGKEKRERENEKERTKPRKRNRRDFTRRLLAGLRQYGNFSLLVRSDMNAVLAALAREAGWTVEPDGTTYRHSPTHHIQHNLRAFLRGRVNVLFQPIL